MRRGGPVSKKRQFFSASRLASPSQVMGNNPRFSGIMGLLGLANFVRSRSVPPVSCAEPQGEHVLIEKAEAGSPMLLSLAFSPWKLRASNAHGFRRNPVFPPPDSHLPGRTEASLGPLAARRRRMPRVSALDLLGKSQARHGRSSALQPCLHSAFKPRSFEISFIITIFTSRNPSVVDHLLR